MSTTHPEKKETVYCLKCRKATKSNHLEFTTLKNGKPSQKGKCSVCNTTTFTILKGPSKKVK